MALGRQTRASPVTRVVFRGQRVHVKRDDVFHLAGNKMRKLFWFLQQDDDFYRDAHLVSFGGTQSNAMLAIAQLANAKGVPFTYFSRRLDVMATQQPADDNIAMAKSLGMRHCELPLDDYRSLASSRDLTQVADRYLSTGCKPLLIPQGAAFALAQDGLRELALELNEYCGSCGRQFSVVVPCGTGATAFYLAQHLHPEIRLLGVPCVGDHAYLRSQFDVLASQHDSRELTVPEILVPTAKARFGRLATPLLDVHHELLEATGIEFDLLYASFAWRTLFEPPNLARVRESDRELLYVHTGGVSGNASMLARYSRKKS